MKTHRLAAVLACWSVAVVGCNPGTMIRCALTDLLSGEPGPQPADTRTVPAAAETAPVLDACDAADDPAVWVNEADPEASLIVATNKLRGFVVYGLDGAVVSTSDVGRVNNVDLRDGVSVGGKREIVVAATNRTTETIDVLVLDPESGELTPVVDPPLSPSLDEEPYGLCLYRSAVSGDLYVFANDLDGAVEQWRLDDDGSGMSGTRVRSWAVGSQTEGCVADDANGWMFIGEEEVGIWRYGAEPDAPPGERVAVDRVGVGEPEGGRLASSVEGLSIYVPRVGGPDDGFLVASSQGNNTYVVYDRAPPHAYRGTFRVGEAGAVDGVEETDGLQAVSAPVGPRYPMGLLVVQDGINEAQGARVNQNFKLVSWQDVLDALNLAASEDPER
ncbi:MAG: phytase [Gemmatimonadota bacterium]|nr:phytase [Gemmatimonadota bacterium]